MPAAVRRNGTKLGIRWTAPRRIELTAALRPTGNRLEIDSVNRWPNRLIGDASFSLAERLLRTHIAFDLKDLLLPSDLLGPVRRLTAGSK
jgi:hypothetical protein